MSTKLTIAAAALLALAALPAAGAAPTGRAVDAATVNRLIATWPADARDKALKMIRRKGLPDEVTDSALIWEIGDIKKRRPRTDPTIVEGSLLPNSELAEGR